MSDHPFIQALMTVVKTAQAFVDADAVYGPEHETTQEAKSLLADALVALMPGDIDLPGLRVIRGGKDDDEE